MKRLIWIYLFSFVSDFSFAQEFHWAKDFQVGCDNENVHICTKVDGLGNIYTTGYFSGVVDFDRGPGICKLESQGGNDIYIVKYNAFGNLLWAKRIGGIRNDWGYSLTLDANYNVYVTGEFSGLVDFDPGYSSITFQALGYEAFVLKLNGAGNFVWAKALNGTGFSSGTSIAVDNIGNVYTAGTFYKTIDFDPGVNDNSITGIGEHNDIFLLKLNPEGNFEWVRTMGGDGEDYVSSIAIDNSNNVMMTGWNYGQAIFGKYTLNPNQGGEHIFISKIKANGEIWAKSIGSGRGYSIAMDASNNAFITGLVHKAIGGTQIYISKFDQQSILIWEKFVAVFIGCGYAICTDNQGNIYITGMYYDSVDFDPGINEFKITSNGQSDIFILKLDSSGEFKWVESLGGISVDEGCSINTDDRGNIYTSGIFYDEVNFTLGLKGTILKSDYGRADFVMKQGIDSIDYDGNKYPSNFTIFPNPATSEIKVQCSNISENISFTITDAIGKKVMEGFISEKMNSINILQLSKGVYILEIGNPDFKKCKLVKD